MELYFKNGNEVVGLLKSMREEKGEKHASDVAQEIQSYLSNYSEPVEHFAIIPLVEDMDMVEQRKIVKEVNKHVFEEKNLEAAKKMQKELMLKILGMNADGTSLDSPPNDEEKSVLQSELQVALKVIEEEGKIGFERDELGNLKTKGKVRKSYARTKNDLPPIEDGWIIKGSQKNGFTLIFKSDLANEAGLNADKLTPGQWYAAVTNDGKRVLWGSIGKVEKLKSWSAINQEVHNRVEGKSCKSVGVGGLYPLSRENLEACFIELGLTLK